MSKITNPIREHFKSRISETINTEINKINTKCAGKRAKLVDEKMSTYLKEIGMHSTLLKFKKVCKQKEDLISNLGAICKTLNLSVGNYNLNYETFYNVIKEKLHKDIEDHFRSTTSEGASIRYLQKKKEQAIDNLYLVENISDIEPTITEALDGTCLNLLGD